MTLDPQCGPGPGILFHSPAMYWTASHLIVDHIKQTIRTNLHNPVVVATDLGFCQKGTKTMPPILDIADLHSLRNAVPGNDARAEALTLIGNARDRDVIIVDDEVEHWQLHLTSCESR